MWRKCFKHPFHFSYHKRGPSGPISLIWALYTNKCLLLRWSWVKLMKHRVVTRIIYAKYESVTNTVREYGPVKKSQCTSTVTLTFESWPWVQIMTHYFATSNICVKYISVTKTQQENMVMTKITMHVHCDLDMLSWPWVKVMTHRFASRNICANYKSATTCIIKWGNMARKNSDACPLWPWPRSRDFGSRS